jgi:dihydrofolate synthase/folylpolyglutamate synthase
MIAAAFLAFRGLDLALVEVGLGGRWDATNASDPILTVLTNVGLDHQVFLGDTRESIGREKLCTARDGRPLVLGPTLEPAWINPLLECVPVMHPAPPVVVEQLAFDHSIVEGGHRLGLAGAHQTENLATALEAARQLRALGFDIPDEAMWRGVAEATWPGRLWQVPGLEDVWMDGAHNPDGARVLADHALRCGLRPHLLFGAMGDKDLRGIALELQRMAPRSLAFVRGTETRYAEAPALSAAWGEAAPMLGLAEAAAHLRGHRDGPLLVTGSLYLLGDLLRELGVALH